MKNYNIILGTNFIIREIFPKFACRAITKEILESFKLEFNRSFNNEFNFRTKGNYRINIFPVVDSNYSDVIISDFYIEDDYYNRIYLKEHLESVIDQYINILDNINTKNFTDYNEYKKYVLNDIRERFTYSLFMGLRVDYIIVPDIECLENGLININEFMIGIFD